MPVLMAKGQQVPLSGPDGRRLNLMCVGVGWQTAPRPGLLGALGLHHRDRLGTLAVLYSHGRFLDVLFADSPRKDRPIEYITGLTVKDVPGEGDSESFFASLSRLPPHADRIVFAVSSLDGSTFATVHRAYCRLVDESRGHELARCAFPATGSHTALIMAEVTRSAGAWTMTALGEPVTCTTFADLLQAIGRLG